MTDRPALYVWSRITPRPEHTSKFAEAKAAPDENMRSYSGGRYWIRTSDLVDVNDAL